ncbi:MAG: ABC transporter ATP-binding protein [Treponema sp.]|nr:ABC transporter ATP-binding protein [Treponema sp.]
MQVKLENVTKKYGHTVAVNNFSTILPDGDLICLLGPSGCGKSTLLNMLCGITDVSEGHIYFDDKEVTKLPADRRDIGMVFQNYALYPHMTVCENISFPLEVQKVPKKERLERAQKIAALVHVDNLLKRYPGELSGGQQQRVAIARALVKNPKLLLMDEPLSNLDARLRLEMREEIRRIQQETGVTTVFVTHDQEEAMSISDSIILMKDGVFIQGGHSQDLYDNPNCKFTADFLGNPPINNFQHFEGVSENKILAVRPEAFALSSDENGFEAKVLRVSLLGKERILYVRFADNNEARLILPSDFEVELGQKIFLTLKKKGVFLFDKASGKRLED